MPKECILFILLKELSAAIPSFEILRMVILRFCGSLFHSSAVRCSAMQCLIRGFKTALARRDFDMSWLGVFNPER